MWWSGNETEINVFSFSLLSMRVMEACVARGQPRDEEQIDRTRVVHICSWLWMRVAKAYVGGGQLRDEEQIRQNTSG